MLKKVTLEIVKIYRIEMSRLILNNRQEVVVC